MRSTIFMWTAFLLIGSILFSQCYPSSADSSNSDPDSTELTIDPKLLRGYLQSTGKWDYYINVLHRKFNKPVPVPHTL